MPAPAANGANPLAEALKAEMRAKLPGGGEAAA